MSKLIVSGHSFGGGTAIAVAEADPRVKALLTHDPWLYPLEYDIWGKFNGFSKRNVATQNIYSASFYPAVNKLVGSNYSGFKAE